MESMYQETPSAYTWIGKVHSPSTVQFWSSETNSKMAAVCWCCHVCESRAWYQVMESTYQETPSAYTWIGKVHSPSTVQFWRSENNSKMAADCCHKSVGEYRHGVMHVMMEL
jgi:hypothetical protein